IIGFDTRPFNGVNALSDSYDFALNDSFLENRSGSWNLTAGGTRFIHSSQQQTVTSPLQETAGYLVPRWAGNATLSWSKGNFDLAWSAEYLDRLSVGGNPAFVVAQGSAYVSSSVYHDLNGGYRFARGDSLLSSIDVRLQVRNVFDRKPNFNA